jgi:hypothetical protein
VGGSHSEPTLALRATLPKRGLTGTIKLICEIKGQSSSRLKADFGQPFRLTDAACGRILSPLGKGTTGVCYKPTETPCRKKRGEIFSKFRFPWKRGNKCRNSRVWPKARALENLTPGLPEVSG